jgi:hypothetical protein
LCFDGWRTSIALFCSWTSYVVAEDFVSSSG